MYVAAGKALLPSTFNFWCDCAHSHVVIPGKRGQETPGRKRQARGARAVVRGGGSCGSKPLGAARLVAAPVVLLLGLVLPEVFARCLFLSPTISVYHVGSWQVHLKYV